MHGVEVHEADLLRLTRVQRNTQLIGFLYQERRPVSDGGISPEAVVRELARLETLGWVHRVKGGDHWLVTDAGEHELAEQTSWELIEETARDSAAFEVLREWVGRRRAELGAACDVELLGPFEAVGMDPVYILEIRNARTDASGCFFRGGMVDWSRLNTGADTVDVGFTRLVSAEQLVATLDAYAAGE